jgi:phosphoribosylformylglycinamidine cyclo-ligase
MKQSAYAAAGVDIDLANQLKATLPRLLASTHRRGVLGKVGGFGGLFALDTQQFLQPVLVSSMDGVGTKLKIAFAMHRHDTVGQDLVNHCVNDIIVLGAEPLFFLDYIGVGHLEPRAFAQLISGFARACAANHCALIGGETAQLPGFYQPGEYDLSGTIVGVVEKSKIIDGKTIRPGDALIGLASNGLHTNGYSLARKIFFQQMKLHPESFVEELGRPIGEALLEVHVSYLPIVRKVLKKFNPAAVQPSSRPDGTAANPGKDGRVVVKGLAHITGGGFLDNIPRILPKKRDVIVRKGSWETPPIFQLIQTRGGIEENELYQVFNMGIGMVMIVAASYADTVLNYIKSQKEKAWLIGEVVRGTGVARIV